MREPLRDSVYKNIILCRTQTRYLSPMGIMGGFLYLVFKTVVSLYFFKENRIILFYFEIFSYICSSNPKRKARHILLCCLSFTTTRKSKCTLGAAPYGRRFSSYMCMVCGEPRGVWRKVCAFLYV